MSRLLHERPLTPWLRQRAIRIALRLRPRFTGPGSSATRRKPASVIEQGQGELYIACAEHDDLAPLPMVEELRELLRRAGTAGELELHRGVHHGFAFPQRKVYDKPAAERHWERLIALYRRHLG